MTCSCSISDGLHLKGRISVISIEKYSYTMSVILILFMLLTTASAVSNCRLLNVTYNTDVRIRYADLLSISMIRRGKHVLGNVAIDITCAKRFHLTAEH